MVLECGTEGYLGRVGSYSYGGEVCLISRSSQVSRSKKREREFSQSRRRPDGEEDKHGKSGKGTRVVDLLEAEANRPTEKYKRHQSEREREWIERLLAKHGDNTAAMARDFRSNPMQQTEANIKKKIAIYRENLN